MVQLLKGGKIMSTRTTATIVNIRGKKMVEMFVTAMYWGSETKVVPYDEAKAAYYNHEGLYGWDAITTRNILRSLFRDSQ